MVKNLHANSGDTGDVSLIPGLGRCLGGRNGNLLQYSCLGSPISIIPSKEIPGLISFRMDWLDRLAVQGTLKSLLQHHSSKASILWRSAFFTVHLSHPYMTTGKTIALTRRTFAGKLMSLLFIMLVTFKPSQI